MLGPENEESVLKESGIPMIAIAIIPQPGSNSIAIADAIYKRFEQIKIDMPEDIRLQIAKLSPATYALEGAREAILDGAPLSAMWDEIWPLLVIGAVSIPLGLWVFSRGELYAKRHGKLKRSG